MQIFRDTPERIRSLGVEGGIVVVVTAKSPGCRAVVDGGEHVNGERSQVSDSGR